MKARLALLTACFLTAGLLAAPAPARAQSEEAAADFTPWSGYWWPHKEGRMVGPLTKYDQATGARAAAWEAKNHPKQSAEGWAGFCHAWSAACVLEKEPKGPISYKGQTLTVADQKAWLTVSHSADSADFFGRRNNGGVAINSEVYQDLKPDMLWRYLKLYVQQRGIPLIMDIEAGPAVWNYPVYAYRVTWAPSGGSAGEVKAHLTLWMADDAVQPDKVGTKVKKTDYDFVCRMSGGNIVMGSGKWIGNSVKDHPDFAWYPQQQRSENPELKYEVVAQALKLPAVARRNARKEPDAPVERPDPVADVENPPHDAENGPAVPVPPALPSAPANQEKVKFSAISASDLLVLIANKTSSFDFFAFANGMQKINNIGDPIVISGSSAHDGYLYLFLIHDQEGDVKLLFPIGNQDNRVFANKKYEFGGGDGKTAPKFTCMVQGPQRVKAVVTSKPLALAGLNMSPYQGTERSQVQQSPVQHNIPEDKKGQSQDFSWHPAQQELFNQIVSQKIAKNEKKLKAEEIQELTGVDPRILKQLGEFAQAEAAFFVQGPAKVDKPAPDKPAPDKPGTDKPTTDKPAPEKPSQDKPATDKPATDKPATDKPKTGTDDKPKDKPNPDKPKDKP
jgi:hypothetical protein